MVTEDGTGEPVHQIAVNREDALNKKMTQGKAGIMVRNTTSNDKDDLANAVGGGDTPGSPAEDAGMKFPDDMTLLQTFWMVTKMAIPLIVGMLLYLLVQLTNTYFVGNLNKPALLAGVGMGNMLINVLCFAVIQGLNGALETLVSQSFGAKKYEECGIFLNRGKVVATIIMVPIIVIYLLSDKILIALD